MTSDGAVHRLVARAAQHRARLGGERFLEGRVAETEVVESGLQATAEAAGEVGDRRRAGDLGDAPLPRGLHRVHQLRRRARLGGGVGDALGQHLVLVDPLAAVGDLASALERPLDQVVRGVAQQVCVGKGGVRGHGSSRRRTVAGSERMAASALRGRLVATEAWDGRDGRCRNV
jgi:hypothetical protein